MLVILIKKNNTVRNILTLYEKTTINNAVYLFEVINDTTNVAKNFLAQDISSNKLRSNIFDFTENSVENLLSGVFNLDVGDYKYNVYEQTSTTNLTPSLALNLIDLGKLLVIDIEMPLSSFTATQETYTVYNGI
jgi:hypothetical protein